MANSFVWYPSGKTRAGLAGNAASPGTNPDIAAASVMLNDKILPRRLTWMIKHMGVGGEG